jgi:hypothetical protein
MHFVNGFRDGKARAAVDEYQTLFLHQTIPSSGVFSRIYQTKHEIFCLPGVAVLF